MLLPSPWRRRARHAVSIWRPASLPNLNRLQSLPAHIRHMRFFFHLACGAYVFPDRDGEELPSLAAARDYAVESARELMSTRLRTRDDWSACAYEVADPTGRRLLVVRFVDVTTPKRRARGQRTAVRQRALTA
jgi:hypothetical protein